MTKLLSMMGKDKVEGLMWKPAKDCVPKTFTGERAKFRTWAQDVMVWAVTLYPEHGKKLIDDAVKLATDYDEDEDLDDLTHTLGKDFSKALYRMLHSTTEGDAKKYVVAAGLEKGMRAWQSLSKWYDAREARDKTNSYSAVTTQVMAKNEDELHKMFVEFEKKMKDHEERFGTIPDEAKIVALKTMIPDAIMANRFRGHKTTTYLTFRNELVDYMTDRPNKGAAPMDISFVGTPPGIEGPPPYVPTEEEVNAFYAKGKGKGAGGKGGGRECFGCGEKGHFHRDCPTNPYQGNKGQRQYQGPGYGGKGPYHNGGQAPTWNKGAIRPPPQQQQQQYGKGWNQQQQPQWNQQQQFYKGGWKGKGPGDIHQLMESAPHNHEGEEQQSEEQGGDGEEQMWAMWSLTEEEAVPNLVDSSDEENFQKVQRKKKMMKKKKPVTARANANRFAMLLEDEEEEESIMMHEESKDEYPGYVKVTATVDSGSAEHAMPSKSFDKVPTVKGPKFGRKYLTANGEKIANEGEKVLKMQTETGMPIGVRWQMTKVVKPLLSVKKMSAGGNTVILEEENPRIVDRNGYITPLRCQGGVFVVDLWIKSECGGLFTRQ